MAEQCNGGQTDLYYSCKLYETLVEKEQLIVTNKNADASIRNKTEFMGILRSNKELGGEELVLYVSVTRHY